MTIEITLEDLIHLTETAKTNGHSVLWVTQTTDGKRATLLITHEARRRHRAKAPAAKGAPAPES